ncbi:MAG: hypothetical protein JWP88_357 [Flaviaesturariibacter sp.]|nr:hypothetical protein [Flaviaesturariibacter sp.]
MTPLLFYALKVILCSSLLTGYYYLALRNKVFHQWNRFYLLLTVVLSFTIPLFHFTIFQTPEDNSAAIQLLQTINGSGEEWVVIANAQTGPALDWQLLATVFYGGVSLLLLAVLLVSIVRLLSIVRQHTVQEVEDIYFINTDVPGTPFSFLRYIFWNRSIDMDSPTGRRILKHELVHVREWHTADKLFMQVVLIIAWCNPIFWIIRHELKMIHEFIADNKAVQDRDASELAAMILQAAYPKQFSHLVNPFFHQSIKRRLRMLTKIQNPRVNYISRVLILPLLVLTVFLFSARIAAQNTPMLLSKKRVVMIDAGHGAKDGNYEGVRIDGLYEDQLTLAIAQQVKELNTDPNLQIVLTREGEERVDLHQRVDKTVAAGADLFVSIHINATEENAKAPTGKTSGFEIYTSRKNQTYAPQNTRLASAVTQSLKGLTTSIPLVVQRQAGIWVLDQAPCPAVLLECGYLTDAKDRAFISNKDNQKAVAKKLLEGIATYVSAPETVTEVPVLKASDIKTVEVKGEKVIVTDKEGNSKAYSKEEAIKNKQVMNAIWEKSSGQHNSNSPFAPVDPSKGFNIKDSVSKMLMIVDGKKMAYKDLNSEDPSNIKHITVLRPVDAIAKYGDAGRYGAMEISTKPVEIKEIMVEGYKLPQKAEAEKPALKEVVVQGYRSPQTATPQKVTGEIRATEPPESRTFSGEVIVQGYKSPKPETDEKSALKEMVVIGQPTGANFQQTFTKVEQEAHFPEENGGWQKFLSTTLNAEVPASKGASAGMYKVVVQLLIGIDGTIEEIKPLTNLGHGMEDEVIRTMRLSPKWVPARQNGRDVRSYHKQTITFIISE